MKIDVVQSHDFPSCEQEYTHKDSILYALGLGYGADPTAASHLQFLYENDLKMVPSMAMVLGHPGFWAQNPKFDITWIKLLHAEQRVQIHKPLAPAGKIIARHSVHAVNDKGPEKGAITYQRKKIHDLESDELLATIDTTLFMRGDGGCGSFGEPIDPPSELPEGEPEKVIDIPTLPQSALIYRLSGDYNPIHADPAAAAKAGFDQPILHGLCTMGLACRAILEAYADNDSTRLKSMFNRFSSPVFPGETIRFEFYTEGATVRYRATALERGVKVLDRGEAVID